jgi:hypothetical protein
VLSLLPAGLGTSEATAIGLAVLYGAGRPQALAATLMLRIATLAVPCLIGMVTLLRQSDLTTHQPWPPAAQLDFLRLQSLIDPHRRVLPARPLPGLNGLMARSDLHFQP